MFAWRLSSECDVRYCDRKLDVVRKFAVANSMLSKEQKLVCYEMSAIGNLRTLRNEEINAAGLQGSE